MITFGLQIQIAFVAPSAVNRSWTWRHASTYWPFEFPLRSSDHGNQLPFISWAKRIATGSPRSWTAVANRSMYSSWLPSMIDARV